MGQTGFGRRHLTVLLGTALVVAYILVRCLHLDLFVTTDEPFWLGRSANFFRALAQRDLAHTYQMAHPGVLTMWAGTVAYLVAFPEYAREVDANLGFVYGIGNVLRQLGQDPLDVLIAARVSKILLQGLFLAVSLVFLNRLFGAWAMLIGGALIAFDPFLSGMDSLLHVDGLFAIASFAAILALAAAARSRPDAMVPWLVAGGLAACAWMTRATGLAIVVVLLAVACSQVVLRWRRRRRQSLRAVLETPAFAVMLWVSGAGAISLLLLPALWVDPFGTMQQVWDWSSNAASEGHERPTFFLGKAYSGDAGLLFYPVTLLWRVTPVTLVGAVLFLILLPLGYRRRWLRRERMQSLAVLAGFALVYAGAMSFGAKKFDRYILPVYPIVALFAALGAVMLARWVIASRPAWQRMALPVAAGVVIVGQAASLATAVPYRLDYFNPLLGGLAKAQDAVQVGWGEGGGEVMAFIVDDAAGREVVVQKSSVSPVLSYFATPNVHFGDFGFDTPEAWYETDYFVAGIQEWQRGLSPSYAMMQAYDPVDVVEIHDVPFFRTYTPRNLPLPDQLRVTTGCSATFGERVELLQIRDRSASIDLYWLDIDGDAEELELQVALISPEEEMLPALTAQLMPEGEGRVSRVTIADPRGEEDEPLDQHALSIQVRDPATGQVLPITFGGEPVDGDAFRTHIDCFGASGETP